METGKIDALRRWLVPGVSFAVGTALNLSGARNPLLANACLGIAAIWSFFALVMHGRIRGLKPVKKVLVMILLAVVACSLWWLAASRVFVPPSDRVATPSQIADEVVRRIPGLKTRVLPSAPSQATPIKAEPEPGAKKPPPRSGHIPSDRAPRRDNAPGAALAPRGLDDKDIAERQLRLTEQQIKLQEAPYRPLFRFVLGRRSNGYEYYDTVELWNDGAPIESYTVWQGSYIEVFRGDIKQDNIRFIPVYYFIHRDYQVNARTGLLVTFNSWDAGVAGGRGYNMTKEFEHFETDVREYSTKLTIQKKVFLRIDYTDRAGITHTTIYEIYSTFPGAMGPPEPQRRDGLALSMGMAQSLRELTPAKILERWNIFLTPSALGGNSVF